MRRSVRLLLIVAGIAGVGPSPAAADDSWSDPFPGVRHLHRKLADQSIHVVLVDLCAAGISVQASSHSQGLELVSQFAAESGVEVAINANFSWPVMGLAATGGVSWGGDDDDYQTPVAFGDHRVEMPRYDSTEGFQPWMREVVSGYPPLIADGTPVADNNRDPNLCGDQIHPRTAAGLTADHRTLILLVADGRQPGFASGLRCDEMVAILSEFGATVATNLDGGGSSELWMAGGGVQNRPSQGAERQVGSMLGIHATGAGEAASCPGHRPRGHLDASGTTCEPVVGWAQDEDAPDATIAVEVYFGGQAGAPGASAVVTTADLARDDLCSAIGSCAHGYSVAVPFAYRDGAPHEVWAYGVDTDGVASAALAGGPLMRTCEPPPLPVDAARGLLRHVVSPESMAAWGFSFIDVARPGDAALAGYTVAADLPAAPELIQVPGAAELYLVDGGERRLIASAAVRAAWGLADDPVRPVSAAELAAITEGVKLPAAPFLVGLHGGVYLMDSTTGDGDLGGEAAGGASGGCAVAGGRGAPLLLGLGLLALGRRRRWLRRGA